MSLPAFDRRDHTAQTVRSAAELISGADAIERAASAWDALERCGGAPTAFQSYAMARVSARAHTARGEQVHVAIARDGDRPMALIAVAVGRWLGVPTLRVLGDPFVQYGDALAAPDATPDHVAAAWQAIRDARVASFAWLRKVRADAHLAPLLSSSGTVIATDAAPYLDLSQPAGKLGARKLRRSRERLAEQGEVVFGVSEDEDAKPWLDRALQLKREWMAARGLTNRVVGDPFWEGALGALTQQSGDMKLLAAHLSCGGKAVAIEIAFTFGKRWYSYLTATDPDYAKFSTGQLQIVDAIKHAQDAGFAVYDFLGPAYPHKTQFTDTQVATNDYGIALDVTGFAGLYAAQMIPGVKAKVLALPPGLRRFIFRNAGNETA